MRGLPDNQRRRRGTKLTLSDVNERPNEAVTEIAEGRIGCAIPEGVRLYPKRRVGRTCEMKLRHFR